MLTNKNKLSEIMSYFFIAFCFFIVFHYHLLGAFIAGSLVYSLTLMISEKMERKFHLGKISKAAFILTVAILLSFVCFFSVMGIINLIKSGMSNGGSDMILSKSLIMIDWFKSHLPTSLSQYLPESSDSIKETAVNALHAHKEYISELGMGFLHNALKFILGLVIGCMLVFSRFKDANEYKPLAKNMLIRLQTLRDSFEKVVFAQVKISFINTVLTSIYLLAILPLFHVHLPLTKTIIAITFLAGFIPVIGNILSNTIMVIVSAGISMKVALFSFIFLVLVHKLEYFLNAKIVGDKINAKCWEIVLSIVIMEIIFGVPGAIVAPVVYSYIKNEFKNKGLI